tara:strand:- start:42 stop:494 length:453 start_codon:yes stop_codon:yes gene_type:complete
MKTNFGGGSASVCRRSLFVLFSKSWASSFLGRVFYFLMSIMPLLDQMEGQEGTSGLPLKEPAEDNEDNQVEVGLKKEEGEEDEEEEIELPAEVELELDEDEYIPPEEDEAPTVTVKDFRGNRKEQKMMKVCLRPIFLTYLLQFRVMRRTM